MEVLPHMKVFWCPCHSVQVEKCYVKVRTSLAVHSQVFQHVFKCDQFCEKGPSIHIQFTYFEDSCSK